MRMQCKKIRLQMYRSVFIFTHLNWIGLLKKKTSGAQMRLNRGKKWPLPEENFMLSTKR